MAYRYFDGKEVNKRLLRRNSSLFVYAEPDSMYYGDTIVFGYDDGDSCPLVTIKQPGKEPVERFVAYDELIYLGEMK